MEMTENLKLPELKNYHGSQGFYNFGLDGKTKITDGVNYVIDNGYYWFISDFDIVARMKFKTEPFLVFKLKTDLNKKSAIGYIEDGNKNILYKQKYDYTSSKVPELIVWKTEGVILLPSEY